MTDSTKTSEVTDCPLKNMLLRALPMPDTVITQCGPLRYDAEDESVERVAEFTATFRFPFCCVAPMLPESRWPKALLTETTE